MEELEYFRCLTCSIRGLQTCSLRVAEHRVIPLTIIAASFSSVDLEIESAAWEERLKSQELEL
jgi:hypothetical protein